MYLAGRRGVRKVSGKVSGGYGYICQYRFSRARWRQSGKVAPIDCIVFEKLVVLARTSAGAAGGMARTGCTQVRETI